MKLTTGCGLLSHFGWYIVLWWWALRIWGIRRTCWGLNIALTLVILNSNCVCGIGVETLVTKTFSNIGRDKYLRSALILTTKEMQIIVTYIDSNDNNSDSNNDSNSDNHSEANWQELLCRHIYKIDQTYWRYYGTAIM